MTRLSTSRFVGLAVESLEARINPAFFVARTDIGPVQWSNPAAWSDDPAATEIPGPDDTVFVQQGNWDIDLGGGEVVVDKLITQWQGDVAAHAITMRNGILRLTFTSTSILNTSLLSNHYTEDNSADPLIFALDNATLVAGAGPTGTPGQIIVNSSLRMHGVVAADVHLSVAGGIAIVRGGLFRPVAEEFLALRNFKSVSIAKGGELQTAAVTYESKVGVGLSTGSITNHGTFAGEFGGVPGYLHATDMTNHGYADLGGGGRLSGDLVNHNEIRAWGPVVHVVNFENSKDAVIGVDGRPLDPGYPAIVGTGTAKLNGVVYVEVMGIIPTDNNSDPYIADFLSFAKFEGRFRELVTPAPDSPFPSSGLRDPDAKQFIGLDYEPDRVAFSLINAPVVAPWDKYFDPTTSDATGLVVVFGSSSGYPSTTRGTEILGNLGPVATVGKWDVISIDWQEFTDVTNSILDIPHTKRIPFVQNGYDLGQSLAYWIRNQGLEYTRFHVVGFGMGAWPADGFSDAMSQMGIAGIAAPGHVHLTLLDAYVPQPPFGTVQINGRNVGILAELGDSANWAEQYVDFRDQIAIGASTYHVLPNAFNINVEDLDDARGLNPDQSILDDFLADLPYRGHYWVDVWYNLTTTAASRGAFSYGWGFPLAPESGGALHAHTLHARGKLIDLLSDTPPPVPPTIPPPPTDPYRLTKTFAVGPDRGGGPLVQTFNRDASPRRTDTAFDPAFTGGVRVAVGDFNGDGVEDAVVGTGPGRATLVRILDGATGQELFALAPFEAAFTGGVFVAAGDVTGDGRPDLVISPDEGGGPRVRVFNGNGFAPLADFFGIDDPAFRGGARVGVADLNRDGVGDLLVAAGFGGGPRVAAFDGRSLGGVAARLFPDFFAFETALRNGVYLTGGDLDGDGFAELIVGGGPGGGPRVTAFGGKGLLDGTPTALVNFFAGDVTNRGGVRVAVKDLDNDAKADLVVGAGTGGGSRVTGYLATTLTTATPTPTFDFDAIAGFTGGVFVG